ncbi:unnamed protein product, partial [Meganyctiphanes norvegica]
MLSKIIEYVIYFRNHKHTHVKKLEIIFEFVKKMIWQLKTPYKFSEEEKIDKCNFDAKMYFLIDDKVGLITNITKHTVNMHRTTFVEKFTQIIFYVMTFCSKISTIIPKLNGLPTYRVTLCENIKLSTELKALLTSPQIKLYVITLNYPRNERHSSCYRMACRFIVDIKTTHTGRKQSKMFILGAAILIKTKILNHFVLLAHPILSTLKGSSSEWLLDLLYAFNEGNITKFESMKTQWSTQPDLLTKENHLREKIRLLCLMEMTFKRKAWDRQLTFAEIATETGLPESQVEVMVMRALSLKLVKGTIDQVDCKVNITWVQPRVLDKKQV